MEIFHMPQRSEEWFEIRRGKISASSFHKILGSPSERRNYARQIIAERNGEPTKSFTNDAMQWGIDNEDRALAEYELQIMGEIGEHVAFRRVGFIVGDLGYVGCSPDLLVDENGLCEAKCPYNPANHITTILNGMPDKHKPQVQGQIWIADREWCDFISYDPRETYKRKLYRQRLYRDDDYISYLSAQVEAFEEDIQRGVFDKEEEAPDPFESAIPTDLF